MIKGILLSILLLLSQPVSAAHNPDHDAYEQALGVFTASEADVSTAYDLLVDESGSLLSIENWEMTLGAALDRMDAIEDIRPCFRIWWATARTRYEMMIGAQSLARQGQGESAIIMAQASDMMLGRIMVMQQEAQEDCDI